MTKREAEKGEKGSALYELPSSSGHKTLLFSLSLVPFDVRVTAGQFMASSLRGGFLSYIVHSNGYSPARKGPVASSTTAQRSARILVHPAILSSIGLEPLARGLLLEHALWFIRATSK